MLLYPHRNSSLVAILGVGVVQVRLAVVVHIRVWELRPADDRNIRCRHQDNCSRMNNLRFSGQQSTLATPARGDRKVLFVSAATNTLEV